MTHFNFTLKPKQALKKGFVLFLFFKLILFRRVSHAYL